MAEDIVLFEKQDKICTLTLNRPGIMNAVNREMLTEFQAVLDRIAADEEIRVVILTGAGGHFSSGADMLLLDQADYSPEMLMFMRRLRKLIMAMRELPQVIICKVRGVAYGVGSNTALAGDFVVASHTARFCEVFVNIGTVLDGGGTYFLPRLVGLAKARELALLGDEFDGRTAAEIGLIYKSVPEEDLDKTVDDLARNLAGKPALAMALIKEGLENSFDMTLSQVLGWEAAHQSIMLQSRENREIVKMFLEMKKK
ncbi:MAG: enoyl-CoA hydratase/isomerase family protein [Deltaproteobacteria bacterium]|nr:enoyl-CoA hydratase/isomerase family protein [Deltaproteobacteria bacterium]